MAVTKSIEQINERIQKGEAVVMTAEEIIPLIKELGIAEVTKRVDVVTTGTFGPMCSSGVFLNFGHSDPPIKMKKVTLNGVAAYAGIAAVDAYLGATEQADEHPSYGGAHVIEELLEGKTVELEATATGTDCYIKREIKTKIALKDINEAFMFNPRNAYQNYAAAINSTAKAIHTYMGTLLPNCGNVTYSTSGELSPLLNDPQFKTIGIGSKIFLGGTVGYVAWNGTQHNTHKPCNEHNIPLGGGGTLSVIGDLKQMSTEYVRAAVYHNYGISLFVGIGIPIPLLNEDITKAVGIRNRDIQTKVFDYGITSLSRPDFGVFNYEQLQSGSIEINGKKVRTSPLSSISKARQIAAELKSWIQKGEFTLSSPAAPLPKPPASQMLKEVKGDE